MSCAALASHANLILPPDSSDGAISTWIVGGGSMISRDLGGITSISIGEVDMSDVSTYPNEKVDIVYIGHDLANPGGGSSMAVVPGPAAALAFAFGLARRRRK